MIRDGRVLIGGRSGVTNGGGGGSVGWRSGLLKAVGSGQETAVGNC